MSWVEEIEVPWPVQLLTAIGFNDAEVVQLHVMLPPVEAGILADIQTSGRVLAYDHGKPTPVATVLWVTYDLDVQDAARLCDSGRPIVDLITILNAVDTCHPDRLWTPSKVSLAEAWATERRAPLGHITQYLAAGITPAEAHAFATGQATPPNGAQLATLTALKTWD